MREVADVDRFGVLGYGDHLAVGVELPARIGVARVLADLENTATSAAIKQALST